MTDLKVLMKPSLMEYQGSQSEGGIRRVIESYYKYLPQFGIQLVHDPSETDIIATHAGWGAGEGQVVHLHGLWWTTDYDATSEEYKTNARIVESIRRAKIVTVPSQWVAYNIARDMRFMPRVVPHGIDWADWQHTEENQGFTLWNKGRVGDVCHPGPIQELATRCPELQFVSTFAVPGVGTPSNMKLTGLVPHGNMKKIVQRCGVYLSTTKETYGCGTLEAMAAGKPILGWNYGGNIDLVKHGVNGYLAEPGNMDDLETGLWYTLEHAQILGDNGREMAKDHSWESAVAMVADIYREAAKDEYADRPMMRE